MATFRDEVVERLPADAEPEIMVNGEAWAPTSKPCTHANGLFMQDVLVATIKDDDGQPTAWEVRLRVKCGECADDFVFDNPVGRLRHEGTAIVLDIKPGETNAG